MKIAITGTHGIPNRYGGFEKFAEKISTSLSESGHKVLVYMPTVHPWRETTFKGVDLVRIPFNRSLGTIATLLYDRLCFKDVHKSRPDIVLNCGTPGAFFIPARDFPPVVTIADGLEWKRKKWNVAGKAVLKFAEKTACARSTVLVSDHPVMQEYFQTKYGVQSVYIPYGVEIKDSPLTEERFREICNSGNLSGLEDLKPSGYYLVIARPEPENNPEMIIRGFLNAGSKFKLVIVGSFINSYGKRLLRKYGKNQSVRFVGGIYKNEVLRVLRRFTSGYFHGHSVGGTNPSLLEAMAEGCRIAAHENPFNRYVLGDFGTYFSCSEDVSEIIRMWEKNPAHIQGLSPELENRLITEYSWEKITEKYLDLFLQVLNVEEIK